MFLSWSRNEKVLFCFWFDNTPKSGRSGTLYDQSEYDRFQGKELSNFGVKELSRDYCFIMQEQTTSSSSSSSFPGNQTTIEVRWLLYLML